MVVWTTFKGKKAIGSHSLREGRIGKEVDPSAFSSKHAPAPEPHKIPEAFKWKRSAHLHLRLTPLILKLIFKDICYHPWHFQCMQEFFCGVIFKIKCKPNFSKVMSLKPFVRRGRRAVAASFCPVRRGTLALVWYCRECWPGWGPPAKVVMQAQDPLPQDSLYCSISRSPPDPSPPKPLVLWDRSTDT